VAEEQKAGGEHDAQASNEKKAVEDNQFVKRQGHIFDQEEDQLAMESEHHDQIAVESNHKDQLAVESSNQHGGNNQQVPVPVPMRTVPGNIIFPMPPGFGQQGPGGPPPQGIPIGMRAPPPPGNFFRGICSCTNQIIHSSFILSQASLS